MGLFDDIGNFLFGDDKTTATSINKIKNNVTNISKLKLVNEQLTQISINQVNNIVNTCGSSTIGKQRTTYKDIYAGHSITIDTSQDMKVVMDLNCVQDSVIKAKISADLIDKITEAITSRINDAVQNMTTTEALVIGTIGGGIGGVFFKMVSDMVQFYFRASGKKNGATTP